MTAAEEDIITLDSGDEDSQPGLAPTSDMNSMSYNPSNYADLLPNPNSLPPRPPLVRPMGRTRGVSNSARNSASKRPGQFPPFALFSQEKRRELQEANPHLTFGDIGRQLGEQWHALSEAEKESYRARARSIYDQKVKVWERQQQQIQARGAAAQPSGGIIRRRQHPQQHPANSEGMRRRTHGYAVFSTERRKQYALQGINVAEASQRVANEWRTLSNAVRQSYEAKATKINMLDEQRFQRQQSNFRPQAQQPVIRPTSMLQMNQRQQMQRHKASSLTSITSRTLPNLPSSTTLRISKVSSLSPLKKQTPPNISLPSGISISRVEPEISIVSEQPAQSRHPPPLTSSIQFNRGRGSNPHQVHSMRARRGSSMNQLSYRGRGRPPNNLSGPDRSFHQMGPMSTAASVPPPVIRRMRGRPPLPLNNGVPAKKRKIGDSVGDFLGLGSPLAPGMVNAISKFCRLCGDSYPKNGPMYTLDDRPKLLEKIDHTLAIKIDLTKDKEAGYPNVVCRKCCHVLFSFDEYKKKVDEGMARLSRVVALNQERKSATTENGLEQHSEESLSSYSTEMSILPDLDMEIDSTDVPMVHAKPVLIKQEKHSGIPTLSASESINIKDEPLEREDKCSRGDQKVRKDEEKEDTGPELGVTSSEIISTDGHLTEAEKAPPISDFEESSFPGTISLTSLDTDVGNDGELDPLNSNLDASDQLEDFDIPAVETDSDNLRYDPLTFVQVGDCQSMVDFGNFEGDENISSVANGVLDDDVEDGNCNFGGDDSSSNSKVVQSSADDEEPTCIDTADTATNNTGVSDVNELVEDVEYNKGETDAFTESGNEEKLQQCSSEHFVSNKSEDAETDVGKDLIPTAPILEEPSNAAQEFLHFGDILQKQEECQENVMLGKPESAKPLEENFSSSENILEG